MPKKSRVQLNDDDIRTINNFPFYEERNYVKMFEALFKNFHNNKKLTLVLKHNEFKVFSNALEQYKYGFFTQLIDALPKEDYKKLTLLYNNNSIIKKLFEVCLEDSQINEHLPQIQQAIEKISTILPETVKDEANIFLEKISTENVESEVYNQIKDIFTQSNIFEESTITETDSDIFTDLDPDSDSDCDCELMGIE